MADHIVGILIGGGIGLISGIVCLVIARIKDQGDYIIERATPLPLSMVNVRDDVWLKGEAECDAPLSAPHFLLACLHYRYKLEEHVTETHRDSKGNTVTTSSWRTRQTSSESASFRLRDGENVITINGRDADFRHMKENVAREGNFRHTLNYLPFPSSVNAVGSVSEGRQSLEKYANIPLIVTLLDRKEFVEKAEGGERLLRGVGFFLLGLGMTAAFYALFDWRSIPAASGGAFCGRTLGAALIPTVVILLLYWLVYTYNTFVTYRARVDNAWRQIDVDLAMRYQLIPELVSAAQAYMAHEKGLLEKLAGLRSQATSGNRADRINVEKEAAVSVNRLVVLMENYPELKAQPITAKLVRELTAIEEKIAHGRAIFNDAVLEYNNTIARFPAMLISAPLGFKQHVFFATAEPEKNTPKVSV